MTDSWLNKVNWTQDGLVPAIAQDAVTGRVLMLAWMNRESLKQTMLSKRAHYWSRSRKKVWCKGEESGHFQTVLSLYLDCDNDAILLKVEQAGGIACHTGRESCFFQTLLNEEWQQIDPVLKNPEEIYSDRQLRK